MSVKFHNFGGTLGWNLQKRFPKLSSESYLKLQFLTRNRWLIFGVLCITRRAVFPLSHTPQFDCGLEVAQAVPINFIIFFNVWFHLYHVLFYNFNVCVHAHMHVMGNNKIMDRQASYAIASNSLPHGAGQPCTDGQWLTCYNPMETLWPGAPEMSPPSSLGSHCQVATMPTSCFTPPPPRLCGAHLANPCFATVPLSLEPSWAPA